MKLERLKHKMRCEMGACGNKAVYAIKMDRAGIRSNIDVCPDCLKKLYDLTCEILQEKEEEHEKEER